MLVAIFKLKVRSINLKLRTPRSNRFCISAKNNSNSKGYTVLSKEDKQNSHLKGQPRDAST